MKMVFVVSPSPELLLAVPGGKGAEGWFHPPCLHPACLEPFGKDQGAGNARGGIPHPGYCLGLRSPPFAPGGSDPLLCVWVCTWLEIRQEFLHGKGCPGRSPPACRVDVAPGDTWVSGGLGCGGGTVGLNPRISDSSIPTSVIP